MPSRALNVIRALYGAELRQPRRRRWLLRPGWRGENGALLATNGALDLYEVRDDVFSKKRVFLMAIVGVFVLHLVVGVFYYNGLTRSEQDVFKEAAKIDSLLQRRRNIGANLARMVLDYAVHERGLFEHVSQMRATFSGRNPADHAGESASAAADANAKASDSPSMPNGPSVAESPAQPEVPAAETSAATLGQMQAAAEHRAALDPIVAFLDKSMAGKLPMDKQMAGLLAFAEQYPDLKLSANFQRFMDALVETEKDISDARIRYSDVVNTYTTRLRTFPGNVFALMYGFERLPYYKADSDARRFRVVEY